MKKSEIIGEESQLVDRRSLLKSMGVLAGAGIFGQSIAWGEMQKSGIAAPAAGVWPSDFNPLSLNPIYNPRAMPKPHEPVKVFDMEITLGKHEILPMVESPMFLFNKQFPGPLIRVTEGDWVQVNLTNRSDEQHTIHWHGVEVPCEMDGVPFSTQWPVGPGQTFRYLFRAQPPGSHFYHCHVMTGLHAQAGLAGPLIIDPIDDPVAKTFPYTREYVMQLSEIDTNYVRDQMNEMSTMGQTMMAMNRSPEMMTQMNGRMMGWFMNKAAFLKAVKDGYEPPYTSASAGYMHPIRLNYFMINGKAYPMTEELMIKSGETIRVRLVGAGMMPHFMHLHGHDFWHVCQDGSPLASPIRHNTIPIYPGSTSDIIIQGTNPGHWHFHDHSDFCTNNNGLQPGGMMTMLMYEDAAKFGFDFPDIITLNS